MLRSGLKFTFGLLTAVAAVFMTGAALAQQATLERVKRMGEIKVCVDQDNLPYSSDKPNVPGFDVEIAREIAKELGLKLGYHWYATNVGRRAMRQMFAENNCDFFPGLPVEKSFEENNFRIVLSKPYYTGGFGTLVRSDAPATALADAKTKGVGVQLGTFADFKLFDKGFERKLYKNSKEMFEAVAHKEIDAAVTPAAEGAWLVKSSGETRLKLLPNSEKEFLFPIAIGVRKADNDLKVAIDGILDKMNSDGRSAAIMSKYGVEQLYAEGEAPPKPAEPKKDVEPAKAAEPPAEKKSESPQPAPEKKVEVAPAGGAAPSGHMAGELEQLPDDQVVDPKKVDDFPSDPETQDHGRRLYKQACYKCHGPNGVSGGTIPDLRKYAATHDHFDMFAVIQGGRLERGMPKWADYLNEAEIKSIVVYVKALPKN